MMRIGFETKNAPTVWKHIIDSVEEFGLNEEDIIRFYATSDEGANILSALTIFNNKSNLNLIFNL